MQVFLNKWKGFNNTLKEDLRLELKGLVGNTFTIVMTKHFTHRIWDRLSIPEHSTLRKMFYHAVKYHLGEILYWYYLPIYTRGYSKDLGLQYKDFCIILQRGYHTGDIIVRTFYKQKGPLDSDKFLTINLKAK